MTTYPPRGGHYNNQSNQSDHGMSDWMIFVSVGLSVVVVL